MPACTRPSKAKAWHKSHREMVGKLKCKSVKLLLSICHIPLKAVSFQGMEQEVRKEQNYKAANNKIKQCLK